MEQQWGYILPNSQELVERTKSKNYLENFYWKTDFLDSLHRNYKV